MAYDGEFSVFISMIVGTGFGLITKYFLDKNFIFKFHSRNFLENSRTFLLYTIMGLATTLIFWCFEFFFHYLFNTKEMRYVGGVIGLTIGYLAKYQLDKRYVFPKEAV